MKTWICCVCLSLLAACATPTQPAVGGVKTVRLQTQRSAAYYLSSDPESVEDTCPGNDILKQFNCGKNNQAGFSCFDVYMVEGAPVPSQRYTLLEKTLSEQNVSPQPRCPLMEKTCEAFLKSLNYNLEFSWFLVNFPTSSFPQCKETYDCKRIMCYFASADGSSQSEQLSCVFKRNQLFFVGSEVKCAAK